MTTSPDHPDPGAAAPEHPGERPLQRPVPVGALPPDGVLLALSTVASREQAEPIARALIEERLAACVSLVPGCLSVYRWQGEVEQADEVLLLIKTTRNRYAALEKRLLELHPYELPELVALAPDRMLRAYAGWVIGETRQRFVRREGPAS